MKVMRRYNSGDRAVDIARDMALAPTMVRTIFYLRTKLELVAKLVTPLTATQVARSRSSMMERLLSMWIEDQNERNMPLSQLVIMEKAKRLFEKLKQQEGDSSTGENFTASRGWFECFKPAQCQDYW